MILLHVARFTPKIREDAHMDVPHTPTKAARKPIGKDFSIPMNSTIFELKKMVQELSRWDDRQ